MTQKFVSKDNISEIVELITEKINKKLTTPSNGEAGQVLTITENAIEWKNVADEISNEDIDTIFS